MTPIELARLAAAVSVLRPDWPTASLQTFLSRTYANRPYRDVAVALTWIACDPDTKTPKRLDEAGPWWQASVTADGRRAPEPPRVEELCDHGRDRDRCGCGTRMESNEWAEISKRGANAARAMLAQRQRPVDEQDRKAKANEPEDCDAS